MDERAYRWAAMVNEVRLYVEGGGDHKELRRQCRVGFGRFLAKAGMTGKMPSIVPCGSRNNAFAKYRKAVANGEDAILLVDSERPVDDACQSGAPGNWFPWTHLKYGTDDGWERPGNVPEEDCHLMVECMECWILVDRKTLKKYFGKMFMEGALPSDKKPPETVGKSEALEGLKKATRNCKTKGQYSKGEHSYELLAIIDSSKVVAACPWAARFIEVLKERMEA